MLTNSADSDADTPNPILNVKYKLRYVNVSFISPSRRCAASSIVRINSLLVTHFIYQCNNPLNVHVQASSIL